MSQDPFQQVVDTHLSITAFVQRLKSVFAPIPNKTCDCGKPVVFIYPSTTFECTRCSTVWDLKIEVTKRTV